MIGYQPRSGGRAETGDELIAELFQTLLTGSRALNILFYFSLEIIIIKKNNHDKLNMGFLSVPNLVPWLTFTVNISKSEFQSSLISFAASGFSFIYYPRCQLLT